MIMKIKRLGYLLVTIIILADLGNMLNNSYAQEPQESLTWSIETSKSAFYPGEPVLFILNIRNSGPHEEKVHFGISGIDAFLIEILDLNNIVVEKGNKIERFGFTTRSPILTIPSGEISQKLIVLNRWCSTLLSPGQYHIICNVEYRLRSESVKKEGSEVYKAGPVHKKQLELDIQIVEMNGPEFKKIIEDMAFVA